MRCNAILFASFLPVVFGLSAVSTGSGAAHPTGGHAINGTVKHGVYPVPTNTTSTLTTPTNSPSGIHLPSTKGTGAHFVNATTSETKPFVTSSSHASGTGASGFAKPSGSLCRLKNTTATISPTGRLPFTKTAGLVFTNNTGPSVKTRTVQPSGTGVSGLLKPSDHAVHLSTGVPSGFAKPSGLSNFTRPALSSTKGVPASGRLPFTSSKGLFFANSTTSFHAAPTAPTSTDATPVITKKVSGTGAPSKPTASGHLPYSLSKGASFTNKTSSRSVLPTPSLSTGIFSTGTGSSLLPSTAVAQVNTSSLIIPSTSTTPVLLSTAFSSSISTFSTARAPYANSTSSTPTTFSTIGSAAPSGTIVAEYYQCGGLNWKGATTCVKGAFCKDWNPYYSQCVRE